MKVVAVWEDDGTGRDRFCGLFKTETMAARFITHRKTDGDGEFYTTDEWVVQGD